jgi:aldehyde:ferredoxin oxidoreductase
VHWLPLVADALGEEPQVSAEKMAKQLADATTLGNPDCFDYSAEGIYSDPRLRAVQWHRHYSRFWVQSMIMCDWVWPMLADMTNFTSDDDMMGATPTMEPLFYKAVTGKDITFAEALEMGHKIFTLDKAIWVLQGRVPADEVFANYVYDVETTAPYRLLAFEDGEWTYSTCLGRKLDRERFEDVKHRFYDMEGWDEQSGVPTSATLTGMDLGHVADALEKAGKLKA